MEIVYGGNNANLVKAVRNANTLLASGNLMTLIRTRANPFFNTSRSCDDIAGRIEACDADIVLDFMSVDPLPNNTYVNAEVRKKDRDKIFYNDQRLGRSVVAMTNTLVHETIHVVDYFHDSTTSADFTHDGNAPSSSNEDAAPNWIGNRAQDLVPMLDDHVGNNDAKSFDEISMDVVRSFITDRDWYGEENVVCPTEN